MVNNWLNIIQEKWLPPCCLLCGRPGHANIDLCAACFADLLRNRHCCYRCGEHFETAISAPQLCGRCLKNTPAFDEAHAPYLYDDIMRFLIGQLKFHHQYKHARLLAMLLADYLAESVELPECLIPMPLHPNRYRQRGFNQAIEISRHLAKRFQLPMDLNSCLRRRDTPHQANLPAKQRRKNIKNAFTLSKPLEYRHIAIVDDVMTTGATANALAITLKRQGIERVDVWACARA